MKTYHTKILPPGIVGREIKIATVVEEVTPASTNNQGLPIPETRKKVTQYSNGYRVRLLGAQARKARRAGITLIPA